MSRLNMTLAEVAHLLPAPAAERLAHMPSKQQTEVLSEVRFLVHQWEQSGVDLDPITFAKVLGPVVDMLLLNSIALDVAAPREEG